MITYLFTELVPGERVRYPFDQGTSAQVVVFEGVEEQHDERGRKQWLVTFTTSDGQRRQELVSNPEACLEL